MHRLGQGACLILETTCSRLDTFISFHCIAILYRNLEWINDGDDDRSGHTHVERCRNRIPCSMVTSMLNAAVEC